MIHTLTTNPAIDMNVTSAGGALVPNAVNRTVNTVFSPNGKGLNVSFTLAHFGRPTCILGFFGGFTGDYVVEGARKACPVVPVEVAGETRVTVLLKAGDVEYTMPGEGAPVPPQKQQEMLDIVAGLPDLECLTVSGSLSPLMGPEFYERLLDVLQERQAQCVLDVSSAHLARLVARRPLLIKPNDDELRAIFGLDVTDDASAVAALAEVYRLGAQNILLTMGGRGAYFSDGSHVWKCNAAQVPVLQTACAGDGSLGAFLSVWYYDRANVTGALRRAMATGGNVAMGPGLGDFALVEELEAQIHVEQVA